MYALCTLMMVVILCLLIAVTRAGAVGERRLRKKDKQAMGGVK